MPRGLGTNNGLRTLNGRTMRTKKSALKPTNSILGTRTVTYTRTQGQCIGMWFFGFFTGALLVLMLSILVQLFINHVTII